MPQPLVSCLMVTKNRAKLAKRAVRCLAEQSWDNKELVIIDDGEEDYEPNLEPFRDRLTIRYQRIEPRPGELFLGGLRNLSLEQATGDYCMQWDDDEWYHPDRIATQMKRIEEGYDAVVLRYTLMHLDSPDFVEHPYRTHLRRGTPGTIVHRRSDVRYPNTRKAEDSEYLNDLRQQMKVSMLGADQSHLFVRCFHGKNTWDRDHFFRRLHRTPNEMVNYVVAKHLRGDLLKHPAFSLSGTERRAARAFIEASRELGLLRAE